MKALALLFFSLFFSLTFSQVKNNSTGFIENKGQIVNQKNKPNPSVKYLLNTNGLNVQLREKGFSYDVYEIEKIPLTKKDKEFHSFNPNFDDRIKTPDYSLKYNFHRIDIDFLNANQNVKLIAEEKSKDYDNYYNVAHDRNGITNVHKYKKVTYQNIYNQIDVVFFIPNDSTKAVEYNFIVKPGGKISDIQLKIEGGKNELVENKIRMQLRFGQMEETIPMSWIEQGNSKNEIKINYKRIKKNVYGFEGDLNSSEKTIVIDPVPVRLWGTYYGGSAGEYNQALTVDNFNNAYVAGETYSLNNISTSGSFITNNLNQNGSSYIVKLNSNGNRIWGTYIHNQNLPSSATKINSIVTSSLSEIYVAGMTNDISESINTLTTPNSHKEMLTGINYSTTEAFIVKFDSNGLRIWGTYFGGERTDYIEDINLDSQDNLIVAGSTFSESGISTLNSFQSLRNNQYGKVGFFAKFSPIGIQLYGSYFPREINRIAIDKDDNIYFAGQYEISNYYPDISTPGAHQTQNYFQDGFLIKFDTNFNRLWCTYYGGIAPNTSVSYDSDVITSIATDLQNNVYICGYTNSINNITTPGAHKETHNEPISGIDIDSFIVKFNSDGVRQWGTFYGDNFFVPDYCNDGFVSDDGSIYITGTTLSTNAISTPNSYQQNKNASQDGFITKFNTNGQLEWGTYYGGNNYDDSRYIYVKNNIVFVSGNTSSTDYIATVGTHKTIVEPLDTFVVKFQDCQSASLANSNSPICIGNNLELTASGGTNYSWTGPNGFTSTDQNPIIPNANTSHSGQYSCTITGTGGCDNTVTLNVLVGDSEAPIPSITNLPIITGDCNTVISTIPTALDNCAGTIIGTTTNPLTYSTPGNYTITWNYNDGNGNSSSQTQNVTISSVVLPTLTSPQQFCIQQNATLNNITISGQNIKWYDTATNGNLLPNTTPLQNGITYYASQTINGCESVRVPVLVTIQNTPAPTGNQNQSFCSTENATLNNIVITGTNIIWYDSLSGNTVLPTSTLLQNGVTYYASQTINGCESPTRLAISIQLINTLNANNYSETICDDLNNGTEIVNLSNYNSFLIASSGNIFKYYNSLNGAQNQVTSDEVQNSSNYNLSLGNNLFYVRIESPSTCFQIVTLNLILVSKPFVNINDVMPICEGSSITVDAGFGYDNYNWSTNETSSSIIISQPGNYSVTVSENHGALICSSTKNFTVVNSNIGTISEIITSDWTQNENTISVLLTSNSAGNYEYSLNGIDFQDNNIFYGLENGEYTVYIRDKNGCGVSSEDVYLLMYPKYFTPNGDGYNDYWRIKFSENEPNLIVTIFDRYGKLMTQFDSSAIGWDGTCQGYEMPSSDYWFVVKRENGKEFNGHFSLKR